jgi:hypothetical protein
MNLNQRGLFIFGVLVFWFFGFLVFWFFGFLVFRFFGVLVQKKFFLFHVLSIFFFLFRLSACLNIYISVSSFYLSPLKKLKEKENPKEK